MNQSAPPQQVINQSINTRGLPIHESLYNTTSNNNTSRATLSEPSPARPASISTGEPRRPQHPIIQPTLFHHPPPLLRRRNARPGKSTKARRHSLLPSLAQQPPPGPPRLIIPSCPVTVRTYKLILLVGRPRLVPAPGRSASLSLSRLFFPSVPRNPHNLVGPSPPRANISESPRNQ